MRVLRQGLRYQNVTFLYSWTGNFQQIYIDEFMFATCTGAILKVKLSLRITYGIKSVIIHGKTVGNNNIQIQMKNTTCYKVKRWFSSCKVLTITMHLNSFLYNGMLKRYPTNQKAPYHDKMFLFFF